MRLRVVAKLKTECVRGVNSLPACGVEKVSVEKDGSKSRAIGIAFIERSKHRENIFQRAFWRVVERKRNQFTVWIDA